jgi:hypothetical protein
MTEDQYMLELETILDEWSDGQLSIEDAFDALIRMRHTADEALDMLKTHDPDRFREGNERYEAELAAVI